MRKNRPVLERKAEILGTIALMLTASIFVHSQALSQLVVIEPPDTTVELNETFNLDIVVDEDILSLKGFDIRITFTPSVLSISTVTEGPLLPSGGSTFFMWRLLGADTIEIAGAILGTGLFVNGPGVVATMTFRSMASGGSKIDFEYSVLRDTANLDISHTTSDGTVTIEGGIACGDANGDGMITFADALYIKNYYYQTPPGSPPPTGQGDVNLDGYVTFADALYIKNYYYQTPPGSPPPCEPGVFLH